MKIELIELKFDGYVAYKYKPFEYCCREMEENSCILFTNEDIVNLSDLGDDSPRFCTSMTRRFEDWDDEWEQDENYAIRFCPHCGEKIEISVAEELDVSGKFNELSEKCKKLWDESRRTDSRRKARKLENEAVELGRKIDGFYILNEWKEGDDE